MEVILLRHGETAGNMEGRYIGRTDEPLVEAARQRLRKAAPFIGTAAVVSSPLRRAVETARLLFPQTEPAICPDLREIDFGDFEGKTAQEMAAEPAYRRWVEGGCRGASPGGESPERFTGRTCAAFEGVLRKYRARGEQRLFVVVHGGSIMAIMSRYARPQRPFFEWRVQHCCGYRALPDPGWWVGRPAFINYSRWALPGC